MYIYYIIWSSGETTETEPTDNDLQTVINNYRLAFGNQVAYVTRKYIGGKTHD